VIEGVVKVLDDDKKAFSLVYHLTDAPPLPAEALNVTVPAAHRAPAMVDGAPGAGFTVSVTATLAEVLSQSVVVWKEEI
jgi:hypothetical protein